jgi:purine-nucleoside phosphorylase
MVIATTGKSVAQAAGFLKQVTKETPVAAIVLGSGVRVLEDLPEQEAYPYDQVFGVSTTVVGHAGSLSLGRLGGKLIAVLRGRFHLFEGHDWDVVTLPARVMIEWGVPNLLLTNAAGGLNRQYGVGDLMLLAGYRDHLHPRWKESGLLPALAAPANACENDLTMRIWTTGEKLAAQSSEFRPLRKGVYAGLLGPTYETHAEIEMLRRLKADAVGMSTVPELITASGTSTTAAAVSVITNVWSDEAIDGHEEVLKAAKAASERLDKLFRAIVAEI